MGIFDLFRSSPIRTQPQAAMMNDLETIGKIKNSLPFEQRGWCNELGLYVQLSGLLNAETLLAGGKYRSSIQMHREPPATEWHIQSYRPGHWEGVVAPSLVLAEWLGERGGLANYLESDLQRAVARFRQTGQMQLPRAARTMGRGELADAAGADMYTSSIDWEQAEPGLRRYLAEKPEDATAWDALREVLTRAKQFNEAMSAGLRALELAPEDGDIHFEVAMLYGGAIHNAARSMQGLEGPTADDMSGCTVEELACTLDEARIRAHKHATAALASPITDPDTSEAAALIISQLTSSA